ncbi:MAG: hypothetical protein JST26_05640 [Bacteroidetes bacterium]|nr:hypothetical protein [Bacteroidota bacterium]
MDISKKTTDDYHRLQSGIDKVIGKIGLQRTIFLLDSFINNTTITQNEQEKIKMVTSYLVNLAVRVYDLNAELFYISQERSYRDARMCCFHLLRKYTDDTFSKIGLSFGCSERSVIYGHTVSEERLSMPKGNMAFVANYTLLESKLIEFIGKIN